MRISIIICAHNSTQRLGPTLEHIARLQDCDSSTCELLIVDNASMDSTANYALKWWEKLYQPFAMTVLQEREPGLMNARVCGFKAAKFEWLLFVDDDNWIAADWIKEARRIVQLNQSLGALGGSLTAVYESTPPPWVIRHESVLACGMVENGEAQELALGGTIAGACALIRKEAFQDARNIRVAWLTTDRKRKLLSGGGDIELCCRLQIAGWKVFRSACLRAEHFIPCERITPAYFFRMAEGNAASELLLYSLQAWFRCRKNPLVYKVKTSYVTRVVNDLLNAFSNGCRLLWAKLRGVDVMLYLLRMVGHLYKLRWIIFNYARYRHAVVCTREITSLYSERPKYTN